MPPSKAEKRKSSDRSSSEEKEVKEKRQKKSSSEELDTIKENNEEKEKSDVEMKETKSSEESLSGEEKDANSKKTSSGWNNGQLFGSETTETTVQGAGFKDKGKAQETLKMLDGRDISYQFQVIHSMCSRAKVIVKRTKDEEKVRNLNEAIEVFDKWLDDYRAHGRSKENFSYLPIETVRAYKALADHHQLKLDEPTFLDIYEEAKGDLKRLRVLKVKKDDDSSITWDIHRNRMLKLLYDSIKSEYRPMYETDQPLRGLPAKDHVNLIMWGYSPDVTKIKKLIPQIKDKLN